jgi:hypothetical protein
MYDQTVRERSGGDMAEYLMQEEVPSEDFVIQRCGAEVRQILEASRRERQKMVSPIDLSARDRANRSARVPLRETLVRMLLGSEYKALRVARFRESGEVHRWMYDRHSLGRLIREAGFVDVLPRNAQESAIAGWRCYQLDADADGTVHKPDSLFMEGRKPSA